MDQLNFDNKELGAQIYVAEAIGECPLVYHFVSTIDPSSIKLFMTCNLPTNNR